MSLGRVHCSRLRSHKLWLRRHKLRRHGLRGRKLLGQELRGHGVGGCVLRGRILRGHWLGGHRLRGRILRGHGPGLGVWLQRQLLGWQLLGCGRDGWWGLCGELRCVLGLLPRHRRSHGCRRRCNRRRLRRHVRRRCQGLLLQDRLRRRGEWRRRWGGNGLLRILRHMRRGLLLRRRRHAHRLRLRRRRRLHDLRLGHLCRWLLVWHRGRRWRGRRGGHHRVENLLRSKGGRRWLLGHNGGQGLLHHGLRGDEGRWGRCRRRHERCSRLEWRLRWHDRW